MDMIFLGNSKILKEIERINLYFKDRLDEQDERINRISVETNSNYSKGYINDRNIIELEERIYRLNEDFKFIIYTDILIIILLTIFIGINIYLLIH
jgi:hypothetical protein